MAIPRMRTINQAAAEIKAADPASALGKTWIRQQIQEGRLKFIAAGNRHLIAMSDLEKLIADLAQTIDQAPEEEDIGPRKVRRIG